MSADAKKYSLFAMGTAIILWFLTVAFPVPPTTLTVTNGGVFILRGNDLYDCHYNVEATTMSCRKLVSLS